MFAGTYTAEAPIGRFQMLSREKGQRSGSRPPGGPPPGGGGFDVTAAEIDVVCTSEPLVPVTVSVYDPVVVPVTVQVDDWLPLSDDGEQEPVTPAGADVTVSATLPVKPPVEVSAIVEVADWLGMNETLPGFAAMEKSGTGGPPAPKNSSGDAALTSPWPRLPPPQTSSISFSRE